MYFSIQKFEIYLILGISFIQIWNSCHHSIFAVFKEAHLEVAKLPCEIIVLYGRIAYILRGLCNISGMFLTYCFNGFTQIALQSGQGL